MTGTREHAAAAGPAEQALLRQGLLYALGLRTVVVTATTALALFLAPQQNLGFTGVAIAVLNGWNACYVRLMARRARPVPPWLVPTDVLVVCALCVTQTWTTVEGAGTGSLSWILVAAEIVVVTYPWLAGPVTVAVTTVVIMSAQLAGIALADPDGWLAAAPLQSWTVMEAALSWALYRFVRRGARAADHAVERGERTRRRAAVASARRVDEREYLAALHDTASATLLMVGSGVVDGPRRWLADQAAHDLEVVRESGGRSHVEVDLVERLRDVLRRTPLTVRWHGPGSLGVPAVDAVLLCHGTREALTNVIRHAGVDEAEVRLHYDDDHVAVEIRDQGRGFDPERVSGHTYGVARSLVERMKRTGGGARITSSPGQGTLVRLTLPASSVRVDAASPAGDDSDDSDVIGSRFQLGLRRSIVLMSLVILILLDLPKMLANEPAYRVPLAQYVVFGGFLAVILAIAATTWWGRSLGRWRWPLVLVVFALSTLATWSVRPEHRLGVAHWSEGDAGWLVVLLVLDHSIGVFVGTLAAQYALTFAHAAFTGQVALPVTDIVNATLIVLSYQLAVGMIAFVLRRLAISSARTARTQERLRTAEAVAEQLHRDRITRYADLADTTVPLLAGLASGDLDPGAEDVRRSCAIEAARMRRLFAEDGTAPDPLLHELRACIELAERNGVSVSFAEYGGRPPLPIQTRRTLTEPVVAALATARGKALLTVTGTGSATGPVTVSIVADCAPPAEPAPTTDGVRTTVLRDGDRLWIRAFWQGGT